MIDQCNTVRELLIEYINKSLSSNEVSKVILHLSQCKSCRNELSELLAIQKQLNNLIADVPAEIKESAFEIIPEKSNVLADVLGAISPYDSSDITEYAVRLMNNIVKIALQAG